MSAPTPDVHPDADTDAPDTASHAPSGRIRTLWNAVVAGIAVVMGILPHVLHHIGLLAGTALIAGAGGTLLFGLIGLAASVPFLLKLYRRFGTWLAPAIALLIFSLMFAVSAFVIGPAISGTDSTTPIPSPAPATGPAPATAPATGSTIDHEGHHPPTG